MRQFVFEDGWPLIQEQVRDEWELFTANILLNMSRRNDKWDKTFATILDKWPTPEALAEADETLEKLIEPHGFSKVKARRLRKMSSEIRSWDKKDPRKLHGCGQYAYDSYRIFFRGERPKPEEINDGHLVRWLKRYWSEQCERTVAS